MVHLPASVASLGLVLMAALCFSSQQAQAVGRIICFAEVQYGPDRIIGAYTGPDGQLVGHAAVDTFLGEALPERQLREGFFTAQWVNLSKSYGRRQDSLWYRKDDLRCELRGGF